MSHVGVPDHDLDERDRSTVWHPYAPMPRVDPIQEVTTASGAHLQLSSGDWVLDGMSSWWAAIHGYRHPTLDAALVSQVSQMSHVMFGGITHAPAVALAERLVEITPTGLDHVFLADSGSVSVEVAIKMALQYARGIGRSERTRLLTVRGGYHGDTLGCMSVCDPVSGMHSMFNDTLPRQLFAPVPEPGYHERFEPRYIAELGDILERHEAEIAAVIVEPIVQGAGGMRFYSPTYLRTLRDLCNQFEVPLILDEIATGFGRTGEMFGCDHAQIAPDIMCVGKALTGGYLSMAAVLCTSEVARGVSAAESGALMHGPTFMGNPLASAVALASIEVLQSRPWQREVRNIETALQEGLGPAADFDGVAEVRILGAIGVIEATNPVPVAATQQLLIDHGVWLRPFGRLLYTMPPFVATIDEVETIASAMVRAAKELR